MGIDHAVADDWCREWQVIARAGRDRPPLQDAELAVYTVLVPLFREARALDQLIAALGQFDYPALASKRTKANRREAAQTPGAIAFAAHNDLNVVRVLAQQLQSLLQGGLRSCAAVGHQLARPSRSHAIWHPNLELPVTA